MVGSVLFYARAIDYTMLTAVNHVSTLQSNPTQKVMQRAERIFEYAAAHPNNQLVLRGCDMVLHIQSDASYLSRLNARSVAGGIFYLGNKDQPELTNGAILAVSSVIDVVVSAVSEAEYAAAFQMAQTGVWLRQILTSMNYPPPATYMLGDNKLAVGLANNDVKTKKSKSVDMRFHWLRDRIQQGQFIVTWRPGATNLADFFTKALDQKDHQDAMKKLVRPKNAQTFSDKRSARSDAYWTARQSQSNESKFKALERVRV